MIRLNSDDPMIDFCVTFHNCLGSTNAKKIRIIRGIRVRV